MNRAVVQGMNDALIISAYVFWDTGGLGSSGSLPEIDAAEVERRLRSDPSVTEKLGLTTYLLDEIRPKSRV